MASAYPWGDLSGKVHIKDVSPRDGFQNVAKWIPTEAKIEIINRLIAAGVKEIEVTSFMHPKWIPQLKDAEEVCAGIERRPGVKLLGLVPNRRGVERAIKAGIDGVGITMSASETHNQKNVNMSRQDSMAQARAAFELADANGLAFTGGVATAFGCPMEGEVPISSIELLIDNYVDMGVRHVRLGDSTGMANPGQVEDTVAHLLEKYPGVTMTLHFHNTRGMGLANVLAGLRAGARNFDGCVAGIGGCPYAPGATGNIDTIDFVHMLHEMGIDTGIDMLALIGIGRRMEELMGNKLYSSVMAAGRICDLHRPEVVDHAQLV